MDITRRFELDQNFINNYIGQQPAWGPVGYVTYKRTYARGLDKISERHTSLGRDAGLTESEEFWLTLTRVVEGAFTILANHCISLRLPWDWERAQLKAQEMFQLMWDFKFLPPGRGLWMMGAPIVEKIGGAALNNCGFVTSQNIDSDFSAPFCMLMDYSMLGVGVGGDARGAGKIVIQKPSVSDSSFTVPDTREGWVDVLRIVLDAFVGKSQLPKFDYSKVRPAGSSIGGFGGTASGPEPLIEMVNSIVNLLGARVGEPITSSDIVDIFNLVGRCVVAGNVRRSAEIMFGEPTDEGFLELKDRDKHGAAVDSHRWASNNSVFVSVGQNYNRLAKQTAKNGEPGYFWLDNARTFGRMMDEPNDKDLKALGGNPCVTGDTVVMTHDGPRKVTELLGKRFKAVVNGELYNSQGFWETGVKQVYKLTTTQGHSVRLTHDHKVLTKRGWVEAGKLESGDRIIVSNQRGLEGWGGEGTFEQGWLLGSMVGDGCMDNTHQSAKVEFWGSTKEHMALVARERLVSLGGPKHYHDMRKGCVTDSVDRVSILSRRLWDLALECGLDRQKNLIDPAAVISKSSEFQKGFLRGYFDADGTVIGDQQKGVSVRLSSVTLSYLELVQRMLTGFGVNSTIYRNRKKEGFASLPDGKGGYRDYPTKENIELVISKDNLQIFAGVIGFEDPEKSAKLSALLGAYKRTPNAEPFVADFADLVPDTVEMVYDCTVDNIHAFSANGLVVHNCLEQTLHDAELCNLVETFPFHHSGLKEFKRTIKFAYLYAKIVTLVPTHNAKTNAVTLKNRRIGCSMSGITQAMSKFGRRNFIKLCDSSYQYIQELDREYSDWLCVPRSIKTTSIKPSGTVSLLPGATPGIHHPHSEYYWRVIRFATDSTMLPSLKAAGYMCIEIDPAKEPNTTAVYFPVKEEGFDRGERDLTMWEQLELAAAMQGYWADNQVSVTIKFDPKTEGSQIGAALELYESRLKGVSFLPHDNHGYEHAPYQAITKEEYEAAVSVLQPLDLSKGTNEVLDKFCDGGKCEI